MTPNEISKEPLYPGQRIQIFTVLGRYEGQDKKYPSRYWRLQCDCGNIVVKVAGNIKHHTYKSCSTSCKFERIAHNAKDHTGKQFGRWTALARDVEKSKGKRTFWRCRCECGAEKSVSAGNLTRGGSTSCGCYMLERVRGPRPTRSRKSPKHRAYRQLFHAYRKNARTRGLIWNLDLELFSDLISKPCGYCGRPPSNYFNYTKTKKTHRYLFKAHYSGIDRRDNREGYTPANVMSCCKDCNLAKLTRSQDEFKSWLKRAYEFLNLQSYQPLT